MVLLPVKVLVNEVATFCIALYRLAMALPSADMHCGLRTLLVMMQPTGAFAGFVRVIPVSARKSPCSMAVVGRVRDVGASSWLIFFHSSPAKKKNLSFFIGPPRFQPKSLKRSFCFCGEKEFLASSASFLMNSKPPPCKLFPPRRVTAFVAPPELRPYSAEKLEVLMLTS